ncbi:Peptidase family M28 [Lishizhenia tianjinensis]|uniref:Peptidase family M28 n=1 Tax=Lishizhenia tianjinensis TaxID=477690 RepID=A0A1I7BBF0_9FLAO|nr:M28 family peptidase [Lishizhenia tianjinensis]SFT84529.1 Peptidase family M28 [Lishizhenia tianjinensis]
MLKSLIYLPIFFLSASVLSQGKAEDYAHYINKEELSKHLHVIASDSFAGRETGYEGQKLAADYLIASFKEDGLQAPPSHPDYRFPFQVLETVFSGSLTLHKKKLQLQEDFFYLFANEQSQREGSYKLIVDLKATSESSIKGNDVVFYANDTLTSFQIIAEYRALKKFGAASVTCIVDNYEKHFEILEHHVTSSKMTLIDDDKKEQVPLLFVDVNKVGKSLKKLDFSFAVSTASKVLDTENVLAFIEGTDSILKNEVLVLTAHYDHIGAHDGKIFNGADDDGTGTVALLEIAEAFQRAKDEGNGPKRSLLIMPVAGEEKGLLGSSYYSDHPIFAMENTITNLNIDMIGRVDEVHQGKADYVYIIGSNMLSNDLHDANERANTEFVNLELDYTYNSLEDPNRFYYRSDHYNFAKHDVPSIFYFSGVHEDYHQATDTVDKIDFDKVEKVSRLVYHTAWILLNAENRPELISQ